MNILRKGNKSTLAISCFALAFLLIISTPTLLGQTAGTGALTGTLKDPSGAVIPNATVTAISVDTTQARTATTDADGTYRFTLLPPGIYGLKFTASGFNCGGTVRHSHSDRDRCF